MVVEVTDPVMGNTILNNHLVMSKQLRACSVFNMACRTIQCFGCYHHGHTTVQCTREERCGYCGGSHATQSESCPEGHKAKFCVCGGGHKPWMKSCPEKQKEIQRVLYQKSMTPHRFPVKRFITAGATSYLGPETQFDMTMKLMNTRQEEDDIMMPKCTNATAAKRAKGVRGKINVVKFGNTTTPNMSIRKPARNRFIFSSKSKGQNQVRIRDESEKGGEYSSTNANRTPMEKISNNRALRSTQ